MYKKGMKSHYIHVPFFSIQPPWLRVPFPWIYGRGNNSRIQTTHAQEVRTQLIKKLKLDQWTHSQDITININFIRFFQEGRTHKQNHIIQVYAN